MANQRRGGFISFNVGGVTYDCHGEFSYFPGTPKRTPIVGPDGTHGYSEVPQSAYIEGAIVDSAGLDVVAFQNITQQTVTLQLANGKTFFLNSAFYSGDGKITTDEGKMEVKFNGDGAEAV